MRLDESHSKQMRNIDNCIAMLRHSERRYVRLLQHVMFTEHAVTISSFWTIIIAGNRQDSWCTLFYYAYRQLPHSHLRIET